MELCYLPHGTPREARNLGQAGVEPATKIQGMEPHWGHVSVSGGEEWLFHPPWPVLDLGGEPSDFDTPDLYQCSCHIRVSRT